MSRMNRRRFTWVATSGIASAALVACSGDAVDENLSPTQIPDADGAPPTLAPHATPFSSDEAEGGEEATGGAGEGEGGGGTIELEAQDPFNWSMYEFEASPGQDIHIVNTGSLQHNFVVDEWGVESPMLNGGDEATVTVPDDAEVGSEVVFYCAVPGHREGGMEGTITVVEAGAGGGEEDEGGEEEEAAAGGGGAIELEAQDPFNWSMYDFEAAPGQDIHVVNTGSLQHNFVVDEWGIESAMLNGGDEDTVTVPDDAEVGSEVVFYCAVPGHREGGMEGTITVVEAGGGGGGSEEEATEEPTEEESAEGEEAAGAAASGPITVNALDSLQFDPSSFEVTPGQEIHVVNQGAMQHDFVVDELDFATDMLNGGEEQTITVPEDAEPGDYVFYCSVPGHQAAGMEGTMTIVEGGGSAASGESEESDESAGASDEEAAGSASGGSLTVEAFDSLQYEPAEFSIAPGQTITVINRGTLQHDFVVDEWGLATRLLNRDEEEVLTVPANAEVGSDFVFYCSVPGHQTAGMEGTLTVVEGDGSQPADAEEAEATEEPADQATPEEEAPALELDDNAIRVSALDSMKFAPSHFSAAPGQQIHLVNPGVLVHDIVVDEWGLDSGALGGGEETTFRIPDDAEIGSEHEFYCSVPGHYESGMTGIITVIESEFVAAATPAPEATPVEEASPETTEDAEVVATPAEEASGESAGDTGPIQITCIDIDYEEKEVTIPADTDVEFHVVNEGVLQHDFNIEDTDFASEMLNSGQDDTVTVSLPAGEYVYYCSVPGHREAGMVGTLIVE